MTKKIKRILNEACEHCGEELRCWNCNEKPIREAELLAMLKEALVEWESAIHSLCLDEPCPWSREFKMKIRKEDGERIAEIRSKLSNLAS